MHSRPSADVLTKLKGSSLEVLSFGRYVIHLVFENGNRLSVAAPFRFATKDCIGTATLCELPLSETSLLRILGQTIDVLRCDEDGSLELGFTEGDMLIVYANDPMYEAYTLLVDGHEYVV
jgi:hypothetical protein